MHQAAYILAATRQSGSDLNDQPNARINTQNVTSTTKQLTRMPGDRGANLLNVTRGLDQEHHQCHDTSRWWRWRCSGSGHRERMSQDIVD